ncbi:MAG TPA: hypothetical protein DD789_04040 [Firmicutes bacterium]|jgi:hypothetical protein|nr:hypothetical protein [Bacillota bacterium]
MAEQFTTGMGGAAAMAELNNRFECWAGTTEPYPTYPCLIWFDTATNLIKQRTVTNDAWIIRGPISGSWGMPVGTMITLTGLPSSTPGFVIATGTTLIRADYPLLWNFAANQSNNIVTDEVWSAEKRYGSYSYGDGLTTFRIPMDFDFDRGWNPASGVPMGQWVEDTLQSFQVRMPGGNGLYGTTGSGFFAPYRGAGNDEYKYLEIYGGDHGALRTGPETAPKHILYPKLIYTGEVW